MSDGPPESDAAIPTDSSHAADDLLLQVYDELRELARARLGRERPGQTLQATALVHEAYSRLVGDGDECPVRFDNRGHFFAAAAESMRRILVDRARAKGAVKRGEGRWNIGLDPTFEQVDSAPSEFLDLHEALERLADHDPIKAKLVELRFFGGLELKAAAEVLGISPSTADRYWAYARAWLFAALSA